MFSRATMLASAVPSGSWAIPGRLRAYGWMLAGAYLLAGVLLVLTGHDMVDASGRPIGADFGMMWSAGQTALAGRPDEVFSLAGQAAIQKDLFGAAAGFTPWHYPPTFLLVAAPLAALPYPGALALWQGASFALFLAAMRVCAGPRLVGPALLFAFAFPASFINAAHGQNGFLTAGLMAGGVLLLATRPVLAGALFALLSFKPQFCVLVPVLMLAQGSGRAFLAAAATGCLTVLATWAAFGAGVFKAFLDSLPDAKRLTLETGATGWEKIQSVFAAVRMLGGGYDLAMTAQVATALVVVAAVAYVWRSSADLRLRQALVFPGVLLATPYCVDYDMVLLAPALALLARRGIERGFAPWEISLLAFVCVTPLVARTFAGATGVPLGAPVMLAFFMWTLRRALLDARATDVRTSPDRPLPSAS